MTDEEIKELVEKIGKALFGEQIVVKQGYSHANPLKFFAINLVEENCTIELGRLEYYCENRWEDMNKTRKARKNNGLEI